MSVSNLKVCYNDHGIIAPNDVPCDPNATVSACCGAGDVCVENLYCRFQNSNVPGTCTDPQWGSGTALNPNCPCRPRYRNDGGLLNYLDGMTYCSDGSYCCGLANSDCCAVGKGNPIITYGNTKTIPLKTSALSSYYADAKVTTLPVTRAISANGSNIIATTVTTTVSAAATSATNNRCDGGKLNHAGKVGVGVSVGILGPLCIGLSIALWVLSRRNPDSSRRSRAPPMTQGGI